MLELSYFKHFDLPLSFEVDSNELRNRFYALSKKYHPDFYLNQSAEKQQEILELSTLTNKAYQTLSNPEQLVDYVLKETGVLKDGEKDQLSADFLMEMMDFNEALMEVEMDFDEKRYFSLKKDLDVMMIDNGKEMSSLLIGFEDLEEQKQLEILEKIKKIYFKQKYFLRIQKKLSIFASR